MQERGKSRQEFSQTFSSTELIWATTNYTFVLDLNTLKYCNFQENHFRLEMYDNKIEKRNIIIKILHLKDKIREKKVTRPGERF